MNGSDENTSSPENHDVMGEGEETQLALPASWRFAAAVIPLASLDHAHDGFRLAASAITSAIKARLHEPPVAAARRLGTGLIMMRRDDGSQFKFVARKVMI
jgi:hypothetical protein